MARQAGPCKEEQTPRKNYSLLVRPCDYVIAVGGRGGGGGGGLGWW